MYTAIRYIAIRYNCIIHTAAFGHVFWMFWDCFLDDLVMFSGWFGNVFWMIWWCFLDVLGMFSRWVCDVLWMFWECFLDDFVMFSVCFGHVFWMILWCFLDVLGMFSGWFCHVFWMFWECFLHDFVMFSGTTRQPIFTRWGLMSVNTTFFNPTIKNFAHMDVYGWANFTFSHEGSFTSVSQK